MQVKPVKMAMDALSDVDEYGLAAESASRSIYAPSVYATASASDIKGLVESKVRLATQVSSDAEVFEAEKIQLFRSGEQHNPWQAKLPQNEQLKDRPLLNAIQMKNDENENMESKAPGWG